MREMIRAEVAAVRIHGGASSVSSRRVLGLTAAVVLAATGAGRAAAFSFDDVTAKAQALSKESYVAQPQAPEWLREITYDQWRDIRFRPERALWRGSSIRACTTIAPSP
jgi:glucans biosynthesis protein